MMRVILAVVLLAPGLASAQSYADRFYQPGEQHDVAYDLYNQRVERREQYEAPQPYQAEQFQQMQQMQQMLEMQQIQQIDAMSRD